MHTESEIRKAIKPLIELYGSLNTSEIKQKLSEVLEYDKEDLIQSQTRNEPLITQRIGNIVAHQGATRQIYNEGFIVDKSYSPALFMPIKGLSGEEEEFPEEELNDRKEKAKEKEEKRITYKKINWNLENERRTEIGAMGEEFVYEREREKVQEFDRNAIDRVIHLSARQGDGFGYDILSINERGESVFIEVKTTTGDKDTPFFMSRNEKSFFEENRNNNAYVYRVYNFDTNTRHGLIMEISAEDLLTNYEFDPVSYMVSKK